MFNIFKKEPEMVQYGDRDGKALARPGINPKTGEKELHIKGEKYPLRCHPRGHVLHNPLMIKLKKALKNLVIEHLVNTLSSYKLPKGQWASPVKEIARVADLMIEAEDEPSMKFLLKQFRDAAILILQEDDAWRFRAQAFLQKLDRNKIKLNKSDKYYFRAKSFKLDEFLKK